MVTSINHHHDGASPMVYDNQSYTYVHDAVADGSFTPTLAALSARTLRVESSAPAIAAATSSWSDFQIFPLFQGSFSAHLSLRAQGFGEPEDAQLNVTMGYNPKNNATATSVVCKKCNDLAAALKAPPVVPTAPKGVIGILLLKPSVFITSIDRMLVTIERGLLGGAGVLSGLRLPVVGAQVRQALAVPGQFISSFRSKVLQLVSFLTLCFACFSVCTCASAAVNSSLIVFTPI